MSTFITKIKYALGIFLGLTVLFFSALSAAGYQIDWPQAEPSTEILYCAGRPHQYTWLDTSSQDTLWIAENCTGKSGFCEARFKVDPEVLTGVGLMHILKTKNHPACLPKGDHICSAQVSGGGHTMTLECMGQDPIEYERFL